ncbi:PfkB family carbohydrate kinase [Citricoccus sp. GCM10030269]|uniref:PfkB family carbohydrate kinase n=1 Tax=Citricoccus sp. GCM10030269 TaxID=3273388 RepID=UPI00360B3412
MVGTPAHGDIVVVGHVARDLVLSVDRFPGAEASAQVRSRLEQLGGKGANQAVGMAQLGAPVRLVGVVGADDVGDELLRSARRDGIETSGMTRRGGRDESALFLDLVDEDSGRRLIEHVPTESWLTPQDIERAQSVFANASMVCLQLQQPGDALIAAARAAREAGARVVVDGAAEPEVMTELLEYAHVIRANAHEAELITGTEMVDEDSAVNAAQPLLHRGADVVAFSVKGTGDVVAWPGGHRLIPFSEVSDEKVVDRTGAGDAFLAGLAVGLWSGVTAAQAGELAAACASSTVQRLGGRPDLQALSAQMRRRR